MGESHPRSAKIMVSELRDVILVDLPRCDSDAIHRRAVK
jgi:hypothetical protein